MKTDKFEKTIRRKLESITPEFHEDDWTKMQNYMHAHTPPTFWQQYGSWLGYAAAATVTSVMAFLYVNQLSQNDHLQTDVKTLQSQIEVIKNTPAVIHKTDTVYVVQQGVDNNSNDNTAPYSDEQKFTGQRDRTQKSYANADEGNPVAESGTNKIPGTDQSIRSESNENLRLPGNREALAKNEKAENVITVPASSPENSVIGSDKNISNQNTGSTQSSENSEYIITKNDVYSKAPIKGNSDRGNGYSALNNTADFNGANNSASLSKALDSKFDQLEIQTPVQENGYQTISRRMNYSLAHRIAPGQIKNALLASNTSAVKIPESQKEVKSAKKAETAIPKLNLKVPYRFGFAQQWEGKNQVRTIIAEVLVSKHFSISTGISWLKIKPKDFYSEKSYKEKTQKNFREDFNPKVRPLEKVENINIKPSVIQIPLTVAYRNDLNNNFAVFGGVGTNFTVKQQQDITFDCFQDFIVIGGPNPHPVRLARQDQVSEKLNLNLVNSVNFSAGIEKSWHPVILQAEGYLYTYFKPLAPQASRSGPGFKIKLLYQIGKKM